MGKCDRIPPPYNEEDRTCDIWTERQVTYVKSLLELWFKTTQKWITCGKMENLQQLTNRYISPCADSIATLDTNSMCLPGSRWMRTLTILSKELKTRLQRQTISAHASGPCTEHHTIWCKHDLPFHQYIIVLSQTKTTIENLNNFS